jgi:hypothetical protein
VEEFEVAVGVLSAYPQHCRWCRLGLFAKVHGSYMKFNYCIESREYIFSTASGHTLTIGPHHEYSKDTT